MQVETKNASLDTMAVTIQALHVSGKQMTLAVFRQLPMARAISKEGAIADLEFWGLVRYSIKDDGDLWAVASAGGILYRCDAHPHPYSSSIEACTHVERSNMTALERYRKWEPAALVWAEYRERDYGHKGEPPNIERPPYIADFKVGHEQFYTDELARSVENTALARRWAQSVATLAKLPQLFIAV